MKQRVISGVVLAVILISAWFGMYTPVIDVVFALLSAASCFEILRVAGITYKPLLVPAIIFAAFVPFGLAYAAYIPVTLIGMAYVMALIVMVVMTYDNVKFEELAIALYASIIVPIAYATLSLICDLYQHYSYIDRRENAYLLFVAIASAFATDVFANLTGIKFGKTKMTPKLSPHKTWEGAAGGVLGALVIMLIGLAVFNALFAKKAFFMPLWLYIVSVLVMSFLSIIGDLMASLIKRNYGAKDYGHIIPGMGGIMDRFDSVIFTAPAFYLFLTCYGMVV